MEPLTDWIWGFRFRKKWYYESDQHAHAQSDYDPLPSAYRMTELLDATEYRPTADALIGLCGRTAELTVRTLVRCSC